MNGSEVTREKVRKEEEQMGGKGALADVERKEGWLERGKRWKEKILQRFNRKREKGETSRSIFPLELGCCGQTLAGHSAPVLVGDRTTTFCAPTIPRQLQIGSH